MSTSTTPEAKLSFNERGLNQEIMRLREVDNATNLAFLALEYGGLAAVIGGAILFREWRQGSGLLGGGTSPCWRSESSWSAPFSTDWRGWGMSQRIIVY